ncbi:MAG: orotidine 5'-phosphate decarboxylase [Candidatus Vogelbacteria bacterium RIFOXYD1_FULL_46_19]|uniref:Orotidine 5'-phosphate decarboxylase n=1 Tax=Candidatus Vogelbacteria bacterium RIFOXYD1_FULL_46_19 TaxID=1802439 RepID=A0A1G2QGW0_9BACT|nr:MAG: orotidine 5'-phosphate decarboxylase [Candidatus Vogelbacteria bacterium RIFOXYD1_FULL_46_19]
MKTLTPAERLIVAADFKPRAIMGQGRADVRSQVLTLADSLKGTGVIIKVNSALRACGYDLISEIQSHGLRVFADLKLIDIGETLSTDGVLLREAKPELLTTMCVAGFTAMQALKAELPDTEVLGVTVLTSLNDRDDGNGNSTRTMFTCSTEEAVMRFAKVAAEAKIDGLISSPKEAAVLRAKFGLVLSLNTPAIRPKWAIVPGDDQNPDRIMTPAKAIQAGADRIVVGRPILQAKNPYDAVMRTLEEIASAAA